MCEVIVARLRGKARNENIDKSFLLSHSRSFSYFEECMLLTDSTKAAEQFPWEERAKRFVQCQCDRMCLMMWIFTFAIAFADRCQSVLKTKLGILFSVCNLCPLLFLIFNLSSRLVCIFISAMCSSTRPYDT